MLLLPELCQRTEGAANGASGPQVWPAFLSGSGAARMALKLLLPPPDMAIGELQAQALVARAVGLYQEAGRPLPDSVATMRRRSRLRMVASLYTVRSTPTWRLTSAQI